MEKGFSLLQITFALPLLFPWKFRLKNSDKVSRVICPKPVKSLVRRFFSVYWMEMFFLVSVQDSTRQMHFKLSVQLLKLNGTLDWGYLVGTLSSKHYALSFVDSTSILWQKSNAVFPQQDFSCWDFGAKSLLNWPGINPMLLNQHL